MTDVAQVEFGMFVARPIIASSSANDVMQANDGTSGAEAVTSYDRLMVFPFSIANDATLSITLYVYVTIQFSPIVSPSIVLA